MKEKYGSDVDEDCVDEEDSEEEESEDEDGEELTPAVDAAILRTLARIRRKDPAIYESGKHIYGGASGQFCVENIAYDQDAEERQRTGDAAPVAHAQRDKVRFI